MYLKTNLYIDGTNLFSGLRDLFPISDIPSFGLILQEIEKLRPIDNVYFYASYMVPRNKSVKEKEIVKAEAYFFRSAKKIPKLSFYRGYRSRTSGKEKGVDVHLAVDIVRHALLKKCEFIVVMTGDSDLIYPLEVARTLGLPVLALFVPTRFSLEIAYKASSAVVINYKSRFKSIDYKELRQFRVVEVK